MKTKQNKNIIIREVKQTSLNEIYQLLSDARWPKVIYNEDQLTIAKEAFTEMKMNIIKAMHLMEEISPGIEEHIEP